MAQALKAPMPPFLDLDVGCQIVFEAIDPATGDPVPDVLIGEPIIRVNTNIDTSGDQGTGKDTPDPAPLLTNVSA